MASRFSFSISVTLGSGNTRRALIFTGSRREPPSSFWMLVAVGPRRGLASFLFVMEMSKAPMDHKTIPPFGAPNFRDVAAILATGQGDKEVARYSNSAGTERSIMTGLSGSGAWLLLRDAYDGEVALTRGLHGLDAGAFASRGRCKAL